MLPTVICPQKVIGAYLVIIWTRHGTYCEHKRRGGSYWLLGPKYISFSSSIWFSDCTKLLFVKKGGNFNSPARGRRAPWRTARTWPSRRRSSRWPRGRAVKREKGKTLAAVCNKNHKQDYFFVIVPLGVRTYRRSKGEYIFACSNKKKQLWPLYRRPCT